MNLPWLILLTPLGSAMVILLLTRRWAGFSSFISVAAILTSLICSWLVFLQPESSAPSFTWIEIPGIFTVSLGLTVDNLSKVMLLVVTFVGSLIHIYSLGYMSEDKGKARYFAALSLFVFAMLGIVLASNFIMLF